MKRFINIIRTVAGTLIGLYVLALAGLNLEACQRWLGHWVSRALTEYVKAPVKIERVSIGLFDRVTLYDVVCADPEGAQVISGKYVEGKIELWPLISSGKIKLNTIALLDSDIRISRDESGEFNVQYLIDTFTQKDPQAESNIDLAADVVIVRRSNLSYIDALRPTLSTAIAELDLNLSLYKLSDDMLKLRLRRCGFVMDNGERLHNLKMQIEMNRQRLRIQNLDMMASEVRLILPNLNATYDCPEGASMAEVVSTLKVNPFEVKAKVQDIDLLCKAAFTNSCADIKTLSIHDSADLLSLALNGQVKFGLSSVDADSIASVNIESGSINLQKLHVDVEFMKQSMTNLADVSPLLKKYWSVPQLSEKILAVAENVGAVDIDGTLTLNAPTHGNAQLKVTSKAGVVMTHAVLAHNSIKATAKVENLQPSKIFSNEQLPSLVSFALEADATLDGKNADLKMQVPQIVWAENNYENTFLIASLHNEKINLKLDLNDETVKASLSATTNRELSALSVMAEVDNWHNFLPAQIRSISGNVNAQIADLRSHAPEGHVSVDDLVINIQDEEGDSVVRLKQLEVVSQKSAAGVNLTLNSDFMRGNFSGSLDLSAFKEAFVQLAHKSFPGLIEGDNNFLAQSALEERQRWSVNLKLTDTHFVDRVLRLPFSVHQNLSLDGYLDSEALYSTAQLRADSIEISGVGFRDLRLSMNARQDGSALLLQAKKQLAKDIMQLQLIVEAENDMWKSSLAWCGGHQSNFKGDLAAELRFNQNSEGAHSFRVNMQPTFISIGDTIWNVSGGSVDIADGVVDISQLSVSNKENQSLTVEGRYSANPADSIVVTLKDINVKYILDLVDFDDVILEGLATGYAMLRADDGKLNAHTILTLPHLYFNNTEMGRAFIKGQFDFDQKRILLSADIGDDKKHETANGYVDIDDNKLDLNFTAQHTPVGFLNFFTENILSEVDGHASGNFRLYGTFKNLDFGGDVNLETASLLIPTTGVRYEIDQAHVRFTPGKIAFSDGKFHDGQNGTGIISGTLTHEHISNIRYDFTANFYDALVLDIPKQIDMNFYATVHGSGRMRLYGDSQLLQVNMDITTSVGTDFTYINDTPDAVVNGGYLRYHSKNKKEETTAAENEETQTEQREAKSDLYLNFNINLTPDAAVHVVMDEKSGDVINLYGRGNISVNYYNKGEFLMYGVCSVDHGVYRFSIQDVIRKNFRLVEGGTVTFAGAPMDADLDVQAYYTVNSASLSDLNAGTTFSDNKVRVNCLLNINGKANSPQLTFDLDLPNVNGDEKQMVRKLIATEEDMNMQILYLLGVGRFYTYDAASRAVDGNTLAATNSVNSFISSTISSQLNEIFENALRSNNWSFGTNLATGQQGWNDIEVEALLSGRLLNNRLLINGQFGYRDRATHPTANNFIGDFDIQYLLTRSGNYRLKAYNETNDRYFTKSALMTQGIGFMFQKDFDSFIDKRRRLKLKTQQEKKD